MGAKTEMSPFFSQFFPFLSVFPASQSPAGVGQSLVRDVDDWGDFVSLSAAVSGLGESESRSSMGQAKPDELPRRARRRCWGWA